MSKNKLKFVYDFGAIVALDEEGLNLFELDEKDYQKPSNLVKLAWAGSLRDNPEITLEQAKEQIGRLGVVEAIKLITGAVTEAMPADDETSEENSKVSG
jgi:hypothetical protein